MKFELLNHLVLVISRFGNVSVLNASVYEHSTVHIRETNEGSARTRAACMQEAARLTERQKKVSNL